MYKKEHWIMAGVSFFFVFIFYLKTMAPTVTFWDAGEFIAASYTLSVPHPPGTPLFVIIGRVLSALPLPLSIAARLNFLSVLCGSAAALLIYLIAVKITETWVENTDSLASRLVVHGGAFVAAVIPSSLRTVWSNATEFEVYAVATATFIFCAWLMVYIGSSTDIRRIKKTLLLVIYLVSLSIGNHLLVMLVTPAVIVYTLIHDWENWRYWCSVLGLFFGVYLLVIIGIDLGAVFGRMHRASLGDAGLFISVLNHLVALTDVIFGIYKYVANKAGFFFGILITLICFIWAYRQRSLPFFSAALGLFLLGFSIHAYLLIRAGFNPPINEGNPSNLKDFWAVIGREQYGSNYGIFPRLVWSLVTEKTVVSSATDFIENIRFYFKYNVPFYTKYFGWQFGNNWLTMTFVIIGIIGAVKHYLSEKKTFWFWLIVFLFTGLILNTYMNFKLGYSQFLNEFPDQSLHEVRERDYFFIVSFAFFGVWAGLGLAAIVNKIRLAFNVDSSRPLLSQPAFIALGAVVFLAAFIPLKVNYAKADRSGNFIPSNYARNIMNSLEPGGIVFTNGDNDTFPLWYIQEVEKVRQDCRVVNLSLLNTTWYIKQMRDMEPKVPISYGDEAIEKMMPMHLPKDMRFKRGEIDITYPKGSIFYVKDIILLDILRTNKWKKPLYFTTTVPTHNRSGLDPYLSMVGAVYRINPRKAADIAASDSNFVALPGRTDIFMDMEGTRRLLYEVYTYETFFRERKGGEEANVRLASHFAAPFAWLAHSYQVRGEIDKAIQTNLSARMFSDNPHLWDFMIAQLYARNRQYNESLAMMDSFFNLQNQSANPGLFQQLAQEAVSNNDKFEAARFIERAIELDPKFKNSYGNLFLLYHASGNKEAAIESIRKYLVQYPDDQTARDELKRYIQTGEFDVQKIFGIPG